MVQFGDLDNQNVVNIRHDTGFMELLNDGTVYEDLNFDPTRSGGPASQRPDEVIINNVIHSEFTNSNNQICGAAEEIPHNAKIIGSPVHLPHAHIFLKSGESSGTTGVEFTIHWELRDDAGTTFGSVVLSATSAELAANPHKFTIYDPTGFAGSDELGAQVAITIERTGGNAGDVIVTSYGIHYEVDTVGSAEVAEKYPT